MVVTGVVLSRGRSVTERGVRTTPKTASRAAVFCRLSTGRAVTVGQYSDVVALNASE
jgi:hypothetical protein